MQRADRLNTVSEYYFSKKLREIRALVEEGKDVINLGIGSPDLPPPVDVIEMLNTASGRGDVHQYQPYQGIPELKGAISGFMDRHYGVPIDSSFEVLPLMGSKEGITHISLAYLNRGDKVLIPELGYPTYTSVTRMVEAVPVYYPLMDSGEPDWTFFNDLDYSGIKIIWANYPHMPTGSPGSEEVLRKLVDIAIKNDVLLVHDNPYSFILNTEPRSVLQIKGAKEVAVELNSLSKSFNMAGWRVGWVCGGKDHIKNILAIKSNMDSGMFKPVQLAAVTALETGSSWFESLNETYRARKKVGIRIIESLGCTSDPDQAGMFIWAKCPVEADRMVDQLLIEKSIFITPGHIFGEKGRHYIRLSLCSPIDQLEKALIRIESK